MGKEIKRHRWVTCLVIRDGLQTTACISFSICTIMCGDILYDKGMEALQISTADFTKFNLSHNHAS